MRISLALCSALIATTSLAQAPQDKKPSPSSKAVPNQPETKAKPTPEELWLYPAQKLSADVESQAWRMRHDLHAILFATLGAAWWKQDRGAAERWIYPAVDEVTIASQDEPELEHVRRLEAARRVLVLVTPLDVILRERLKDTVKNMTANTSDRRSWGARVSSADALVLASENAGPAQFARALSEALQYGVTSSVVFGIDRLTCCVLTSSCSWCAASSIATRATLRRRNRKWRQRRKSPNRQLRFADAPARRVATACARRARREPPAVARGWPRTSPAC
jgi:hypothetical protein